MKLLLAACAAVCFSFLPTNLPERTEALSARVIMQNTNGYFALSDGSVWKVIGFSKRWRSLNEWWNNVQLVPENYECVPNDWVLGTQIEAYAKYGNLQVKEADASNQEDLKQCTHLLFNKRTGQVLFAIQMNPGECLVQLYNAARQEGYDAGLHQGKLSSFRNAQEAYNDGRTAGYRAGYTDGVQARIRQEPGEA